MTISKLLSACLVVAAMFASSAMARESGAKVQLTAYAAGHRPPAAYKRHCVRAPDKGAYATAPWRKPPCETASSY